MIAKLIAIIVLLVLLLTFAINGAGAHLHVVEYYYGFMLWGQ